MTIPDRSKSLGPNGILALAGFAGLSLAGARRFPPHLTRGRRRAICHAMADVSFPAAFGAGLLSFVSPCVLPLAAPYLCYLAGASVEALADESETQARRDILITAVLFVAGFSTVFVGLGATASALGSVLRQWSHALSIAAGIGVILMGLHFLGVFRDRRDAAREAARDREAGGSVERLSDGLRLRARLDPLHRSDPGHHSRRRRQQGYGRERRGAARRL